MIAQPRPRLEAIARDYPRLAGRPSRVLVLAATSKMPYRTIQCLAAVGVEAYALGGPGARGLKYSRRLAEFIPASAPIDGSANDRVVRDINKAAKRLQIDAVIAGDALATRSLIGMRARLDIPCFPMPDLAAFDLLNDKWRFYQLCLELGVDTPATRLFDTLQSFRDALGAGEFQAKLIAKPLSMTGSEGCIVVDPAAPEAGLSRIAYAPILVQDFLDGEDIGTSALCENGEVRAFVLHRYGRNVYQTFFDERVLDVVERIARAVAYDGVFNFDMRLTPEGRIAWLECNPRVFFKIAMSMYAGVNFVAMGFGSGAPSRPYICPTGKVRLPKALALALATPWRTAERDWRASSYMLADPVFYIREELGWEEDRQLG